MVSTYVIEIGYIEKRALKKNGRRNTKKATSTFNVPHAIGIYYYNTKMKLTWAIIVPVLLVAPFAVCVKIRIVFIDMRIIQH